MSILTVNSSMTHHPFLYICAANYTIQRLTESVPLTLCAPHYIRDLDKDLSFLADIPRW